MNSKPLKIVIFDGSFETTSFIKRLVEGLASKNKVYVFGFNEKLKRAIPGVRYVSLGSNQNNLRFVWVSLIWAGRMKSIRAFWTVFKGVFKGGKRRIQQQNFDVAIEWLMPDVVHLQWPSVMPFVEKILSKRSLPVVLSQRGYQTNVVPFVHSKKMKYLKYYYPMFCGFHSVSKAISQKGDLIWLHEKKLDRVIYTGLPLDSWKFNTNYQKLEKIKLISVGRPHWKKGYNYAVTACSILKQNGIHFEYIILGGKGDEELEFLVNDLDLQNEVCLMERVNECEMKDFMSRFSLMLLPSIEEGLPNVAVEAMAIGLPVIAFNIDGLPELIEHGINGWLVPSRDVEAMADAIVDFRNMSLEEIETIRKEARKKVEWQHNEKEMIDRMESLYKHVIVLHAERIAMKNYDVKKKLNCSQI